MENKQQPQTFRYTYSAKQQEEIRNIRNKYVAPEADKMEQLRRLDASVVKKAIGVSISLGVVGTLILGTGMSLTLSEIGGFLGIHQTVAMILGMIIGIVGIVIVVLAYPIYLWTLKREREKAAPEILRLTNELMQ